MVALRDFKPMLTVFDMGKVLQSKARHQRHVGSVGLSCATLIRFSHSKEVSKWRAAIE